MGFDFEHSIEIDRPAEPVFRYLADFENNPQWQGGMQSCRWTSDEAGVVGATYVQEARFLGRRIDTYFVVTELEPGRRISIESTQSTFPIQVTRSVQPLGEGRCRVTAHVRGQPGWPMSMMSGMVRRSIRKDYERLKARLESQG
ncbi:MAG: SRPBCC family protein [Myxococcales bacterium]|nr:SRPBCC family protein [Myxococcales bacterium]MCB9717306.1 SRPBCC family protein [Myxococcales bacterium]